MQQEQDRSTTLYNWTRPLSTRSPDVCRTRSRSRSRTRAVSVTTPNGADDGGRKASPILLRSHPSIPPERVPRNRDGGSLSAPGSRPEQIEEMEESGKKIEAEKAVYRVLMEHPHPNIVQCILYIPEGIFLRQMDQERLS
ncbi:uncharacterized protein P884DRAFT_293947 [Thermothelomyces heterothallicus CBS 202.75]|uniref:uncharacterized protein n=1 Tax=Thermothelomyces heterothallicus CBS 202.75 TaxID=1149848 RepID=UPI003743C420